VRARLVRRAEEWRWSSVSAHFAGKDDHVVRIAPALERVRDFRAFLGEYFDEAFTYAALRRAETIGRPVSSVAWLEEMAAKTGQQLLLAKRGPKPKDKPN
jgi:putative transposase